MSAALRVLAVCLLVVSMGTPARALSLRDFLPETARRTGLEGGDAFDALADAIADTAARNLPVISASAGFTYRYNPALEVFERTSETLGPLFLERPDTLGRGKLNVNISYQYVELDEYDGDDMGSLQAPDPIVARVVNAQGELLGFTANDLRYNLQLINHVIGLSATYGILDNLDVNLLVPLISTDYDVTATTTRRFAAEPGGPFLVAPAPPRTSTLTDSVFGIGDIFLRGKYQLPRAGGLRSAAGLQFRLPSGDVDDFQGTGEFEISPFFYASTVLWRRVEPHANLGIDIRTDDAARSQGRYGVGVDVDITRRIGAAIDFLGRSEFKRSSPPGETSFLHLTSAGPQLRPLLGAEFDRKDFFDLSFGARGVVWRQIMVFVNGIYALNDDGLRSSEIIPTIGVEGTF